MERTEWTARYRRNGASTSTYKYYETLENFENLIMGNQGSFRVSRRRSSVQSSDFLRGQDFLFARKMVRSQHLRAGYRRPWPEIARIGGEFRRGSDEN